MEPDSLSDVGLEMAKLQEQLRLCQLELAQAREIQELDAERLVRVDDSESALVDVTEALSEWLGRQDARVRNWSWIKRRAFPHLPRAEESADLDLLMSSPLMDGAWYLRAYPEVAGTGLSPALHYLRHGASSGRDPGPGFSTDDYRRNHPDLPRRANPLLHYLRAEDTGR